MSAVKIKTILEQISQLRLHEVALLNEAIKKEFNITARAAQPVSIQGNVDEDASAAPVKSSFTVKLTRFDDGKKVALIKEIKKLVEGINLVEAKRFVEDCPKIIKANLTKDEAESLKKQLETAGGVVKLE